MIWGTISDYFGRRPITAACLLVLSLSCIGLALVPTSAYWLLMILRCLQAAGSASTIAIGNIYLFLKLFLFSMSVGAGVIGDISSRAERGVFFGFFMLGPLVSRKT
jgi:MFS family permease